MYSLLYVDDEPELLKIGRTFLEKTKEFTVRTLTSAIDGMEFLVGERVDAIVSDYQMPGMDGIAFLKALRTRGDETPFIIFTGKGREEVVIEALNAGADFYLQKGGNPKVQFAELANKIHYAISRRQAEDSLAASEEKYRHLIEHSNESIVVAQDGMLRLVNSRTVEYTGYSKQELLSGSFSSFIHPDDRDMVVERYQKRIRGEESPSRYSFRLIPKGRSIRWVEISAVLIDWDGRPATLNFLTDITERKQAEEALRIQHDLVIVLNRCINLKEAFNHILSIALQVEGLDAGGIYLVDPVSGMFDIKAHRGLSPQFIESISHYNADADQVQCAKTRGAWYGTYHEISRIADLPQNLEGLRAIATIPVVHEGEMIAILNMASHTADEIPLPSRHTLETLAMQIGSTFARIRSREALRESESYLSSIIRVSPIGIGVVSNRIIQTVNDRICQMTGYTADELIGKSSRLLYPTQEDYDYVGREKYTQITHKGVGSVETRWQKKDGTIIDILLSSTPVDPSNLSIGVTFTALDITEQKRAEEVLRESETSYRHVVEDQTEFICRFLPDGTHVFVNEAYCRYFGLNQLEVIGTRFQPKIHPEDRERVVQLIASLTVDCPLITIDQRIIMSDGSTRWQRWVDRAIFCSDGTLKEYQSVGRDITEYKHAEEALRESEEKYRELVENANSIILKWNETGNITFFNEFAQRFFGYTPDEIIGKPVMGTIVPATESGSNRDLSRMIDEIICHPENFIFNENENITRDGRRVWIQWQNKPLMDETGQFVGLFSIGTDITERKRSEMALQRQSATLSILNAIISTANKADDLQQLLKTILEELLLLLDFDAGGIYLVDRFTRTANVVHSKNLPSEVLAEIQTVYIDKKPYDTLFIKNEPIITENYAQIAPDRSKKFGFQSMASIPLLSKDVTIGALNIASTRRYVISEDEKQTLISIGKELGSTIERMAAEDEVKNASKNFETLFNSIDEMVFVLDLQGNILVVNDAVLKCLSYSSEGLTGTNVLMLHVPERRDEALHIIQGMIARKVDFCPVPVLTKNGTRIEVETKVTRGWWNNQEVLIGVSRDVTERKRVEDALRESEERYRSVVEDQTEFICRFLPDGTHIFVNDAYCRYFDRKREDIIGHRFRPILHPEDQEIVARHIAALTPQHPVMQIDQRIIMPNGSLKWQRWSDRAIFSADGQLTEYQSVGRDITEHKEAERALLESETRLHTIIHGSPIPKFVIDKNHCLIYWNKALEEYSGIKASEVIGTNQQWRAFYPHERPCMADLLVDGTVEKIPHWYEGKYSKSKFIEGAYEATDFFPKLGKIGTWLHFTAAPIRDTEGNIIGAMETLEDITEQKRFEEELLKNTEELHAAYEELTATDEELRQNVDDLGRSERALRQSEERYRSVVEDQTEFICRFLPDGTHIFVNDAYCRYFDKKREEIIGHRFRPRIPSEDREIVARHIAALTPQHPVMHIDQRIIMPNGSLKWQRWSDRAIFDSNGGVVEYQSVGRDITQQKELEEEMYYNALELKKFSTSLASANKKLKLLSSITRHDINNQMMVLQGYLEILKDLQIDPSHNEFFKKIDVTAKRIDAMIRFTKEYEEIGITTPAWQDCRTLVDTAAKQAPLGQVLLKNDLPAGNEVFADPLITKVYYNLMDNAVQYGRKVTTIRFSLQKSGDDHLIICEDDGYGVLAEDKEKIFERGFGKNTGLGLALSREILDLTGMTIIETGKIGVGARFEMKVPKGGYRHSPGS